MSPDISSKAAFPKEENPGAEENGVLHEGGGLDLEPKQAAVGGQVASIEAGKSRQRAPDSAEAEGPSAMDMT